MRKIAFLLSLLLLFSCAAPCSAADGAPIVQSEISSALKTIKNHPIQIYLDGSALELESEGACPPVIIRGRTLIPARALFEGMGAEVSWASEFDEASRNIQKVDLKYKGNKISLTIGSADAEVNGENKLLDVPALIIDHDGDGYGSTMIPLRFVGEAIGCSVSWDNDERRISVLSPAEENGSEASNDAAPAAAPSSSGESSSSDAAYVYNGRAQETPYGNLPALTEAAAQKLIYIDPGHGGSDSGAIGHEKQSDQIYEKDLNLPAALKLRDYIETAGGRVYMMRETDVLKYAPAQRAFEANSVDADVYIAVHNNSSESKSQKGTESFYYDKPVYPEECYELLAEAWEEDVSKAELSNIVAALEAEGKSVETQSLKEAYGMKSSDLAKAVEKSVVETLGTESRGAKSGPSYAVLRRSRMPAIIIEGAFLSNEDDFALMKQEDYTEKYAFAIAKALIEVLNENYQ